MVTRDPHARSQRMPVASWPRPQRRWLTIATTLLICGVCAVQNGAEQFDSGWAVSTPSSIAPGQKHPNPQHELTLRQVLEQSQKPMLSREPGATHRVPGRENKNSPLPADPPRRVPGSPLRYAVRPDGIEGWRSAGPVIPSPGLTWQAQPGSQTLAAPLTLPARDESAVDPTNPDSEAAESDDASESEEHSFGALIAAGYVENESGTSGPTAGRRRSEAWRTRKRRAAIIGPAGRHRDNRQRAAAAYEAVDRLAVESPQRAERVLSQNAQQSRA